MRFFILNSSVLALLLCGLSQANAGIINGGFETGDFSGWTTGPISYPESIVTGPVNSGTFAAQIAGYSFAPDTLSQTVSDTAGQSYVLDFWLFVADGSPTTSLTVDWGNSQIFSETNIPPFNVYQEFSFNVVGTGSDTLVFTCANDPSFTYLDDVSLTAVVPEPSTFVMWSLLAGAIGITWLKQRNGMPAAV